MKNLINLIENNKVITDKEKEMLIDSISIGGSVSVSIRMVQTEIKMAVLEILHNANSELTITEIQNRFELANNYAYTVQRFSAMANQLRRMDLVDKNYVTTGNYLIINGKKYPEKIAKFFLKKA
jgi:hypothetical protein